jgi:catechol 2,3-dioxygenase
MSASPPWWVDPWDLASDLAKIEQQWAPLREIVNDATLYGFRNPSVSGWTLGEHAGHSVLVAHSMARAVENNLAHPDRHVDRGWTEHTAAVLEAGRFPRGRAKTPEAFDPRGRSRDDFVHALAMASAAWARLRGRSDEVAACPARARHVVFGYLTSAEWVRMCAIHTAHHLAIVRDIRGESASTRAPRSIDSRVDVGHVHLKVSDLERAVRFYTEALGFELTQRYGSGAAFLSAGGYHHHIGLNTWESAGGPPPPPGTTGLYHVAFRYPDRAALAVAYRRLIEHSVPLDGASDHGVSEALYLHDPDQNGVELYWDRPREEWPRAPDGGLAMVTRPLDLEALRRS